MISSAARAACLLLVVGAVACGGSRASDPPPGGEAVVQNRATPSDAPASPAMERDAPAKAADPRPFTLEASSDPDWPSSTGQLIPVDVRVGVHDGFERVVFHLEGTGAPGWRVEYVDAAIEDPTGERLEVAGDHTLQVILTGVRYPDDADVGRLATGSVVPDATRTVAEVQVRGIFEGQNQSFVGLSRRAPFRVFNLSDPPRVVIDLAR